MGYAVCTGVATYRDAHIPVVLHALRQFLLLPQTTLASSTTLLSIAGLKLQANLHDRDARPAPLT